MSDGSPEANARKQAMRSRMAEADAEAARSDLAFASGRFQEYFTAMGKAAEKRIEDRYAEFYGDDDLGADPAAETGSGGEGGGGSPGDSDAEDGGDSSHEPREEGRPPPA